MAAYFRLPSEPPQRTTDAFVHAHAQAQRCRRARAAERRRARTLDGFALLRAAQAEDPSTVAEVSIAGQGFADVSAEDLGFFTALRAVDAGDNEGLALGMFAPLPNLEELHLPCNMLASVGGGDAFLLLHTLNVAFNRLTAADFVAIGACCPALQRLDFSHNELGDLRRESANAVANATAGAGAAGRVSGFGALFPQLVQLAIEGNGLRDGTAVFSALSDLPRIDELNCNNNKFETVTLVAPPPRVANGSGPAAVEPYVPFPSLTKLGLAHNQIASVEAVAALARLVSLRRVILWGNPLSRQRRFEGDLASAEFESIGVQALVAEPAKLRAAKIGKFYNKDDCPYFAVEPTDGSGLPRLPRGRRAPASASVTSGRDASSGPLGSRSPTSVRAVAPGAATGAAGTTMPTGAGGGPSFFMTEATAVGDRPTGADASGTAAAAASQPAPRGGSASRWPPQAQPHAGAATTTAALAHREPRAARAVAAASGSLPSPYGEPLRDAAGPRSLARLSPMADPDLEAASADRRAGAGAMLDDVVIGRGRPSAGATLRSVVNDLRRALRQPLPPLPS